jgi:hypothetical protein
MRTVNATIYIFRHKFKHRYGFLSGIGGFPESKLFFFRENQQLVATEIDRSGGIRWRPGSYKDPVAGDEVLVWLNSDNTVAFWVFRDCYAQLRKKTEERLLSPEVRGDDRKLALLILGATEIADAVTPFRLKRCQSSPGLLASVFSGAARIAVKPRGAKPWRRFAPPSGGPVTKGSLPKDVAQVAVVTMDPTSRIYLVSVA